MHMRVYYASCIALLYLVKQQRLYRRTGVSYMLLCVVFLSAVRSVVPPSLPSARGGGRGLAIADSHHKLGTLLGSSRGYILPAGMG